MGGPLGRIFMRISTPKSEAMFLSWKKVERPLRVRDELLTQVKEFMYLRVLFTYHERGDSFLDSFCLYIHVLGFGHLS